MIYQRPFSQRVKDIGHWQVNKISFTINKKIFFFCFFKENYGIYDYCSDYC